MAIAATNLVYNTQGPTQTGQVMADSMNSSAEVALTGIATITLDGATTSAVINFIDGTATLAAAPKGVIASVTAGGTQAAFVGVNVTAITSTSMTVLLSAAGTNAATLKIAFIVLK